MSPHWRTMTERNGPWLYAEHLPKGRDVVVEIERVELGQVTGQDNRKANRCVLHFKGKKRPLALNSTNGKAVAAMYGPMTESWPGKLVALYVGETRDPADGTKIDCVRIRNKPPRTAADTTVEPEPPAQEQRDG